MKKVIDISCRGEKLAVRYGQLQISRENAEDCIVPMDEIGVVLLSQPAVSLSGAVLSALCEAGAVLVSCNANYSPVGMLLPFADKQDHARICQMQLAAGKILKRKLWTAMIRRKIAHQALLLKYCGREYRDLQKLSENISGGDPHNREGLAAQVFWNRLGIFPRREREEDDANRLFNYVYTVLYAAAARAICAAGMFPAIGLHHCNHYNPFCLASDLIEPFRLWGDAAVLRCLQQPASAEQLTPENKRFLLKDLLNSRPQLRGKREDLFACFCFSAVSLRNSYLEQREQLLLPECAGERELCGLR